MAGIGHVGVYLGGLLLASSPRGLIEELRALGWKGRAEEEEGRGQKESRMGRGGEG